MERLQMRNALVVRATTVTTLLVGVVCQFVQRTDPVFPLLYFTVDSAILLIAALVIDTTHAREAGVANLRGTATVGVVLSGIVFAAVIAPATETGTWFQPHDDLWVRVANVLLHGVGPILAVGDFLLHTFPRVTWWRTGLIWCAWPLAYASVLVPLDVARVLNIPYSFLQIRGRSTILPVIIAIVGLFAIVFAIGSALAIAHRRITLLRSRSQ